MAESEQLTRKNSLGPTLHGPPQRNRTHFVTRTNSQNGRDASEDLALSLKDDSISAEKVALEANANAEQLDEDFEIDDDEVSAGIANKGPYASGQSAQ